MRLQSPALYYLKALTCHPDNHSNAAIKELLDDERLDYLSDSYIDKVRASMKPPDPFYPTDKRHAKSFSFILNAGIHRLFLPDELMRMAKRILNSPRAKEFVESMLLVRVPFSVIAAYVTEHRGIFCTGEALRIYQHYFWNIDLLDSTEMRVLIALRTEQAAERVPELKGMKKILTSAYFKDARKVAADLPFSPTTAMLAQMRLGIRPGKANLALRMMEARDLAIARAVEAIQQDGPNDSMKCLNYINSSRMLEEMLQMVAKPEDQLQDQLRAIALRTETRELPSIHQLSAGKHTVDLAPLEDSNDTSKALVAGEGDVGSDGRTEG
jgi:hypothetical protein